MVDFKINPDSVKISKGASFMAGTSDGMTQADIDAMRTLSKKTILPLEITGKTADGKEFSAKGTSGKADEISSIKVGNMQYKLVEGKNDAGLEVKLKDGKLDSESIKSLEQVIGNGSITTGGFLSKKTIRSEYVPDKVSSLSNDEAMKVALAQASQPDAGFKSDYNNTPSSAKSQEKSTVIS